MSSATAESRVKVLIVAPAPVGDERIGGIVNWIRGFVHFMPADFEVAIVGVAVGNELAIGEWQTLTVSGREVGFMPVARIASARRSGRVPTKAKIVAGMLRYRRRIDTRGHVAQVHAPAMDLGLLWRGVPTIRVVHNAPADLATNSGESTWRRAGWALHGVERLAFRRAAAVYFVHEATYAEYAARAGDRAARLHFLPNGVDSTVFHPLPEEERSAMRAQLAAELDIPADGPWLLFASRIDHQKDPDLLVRAFAEYATRADGASAGRLLVVGDGRLRGAAEALAGQLGVADRVHFLGTWPRERLAAAMPAADAFVLSSAFEATPFVILEALASGLPVAATPVGEVPNLVHHGETGWIAADRSPRALAEAIGWALRQPRDVAARCAASVVPYELRVILEPLYGEHRRLAGMGR